MDWVQILNGIIVMIGIPTLVGMSVSFGKKLNTLETIENDLKENIRPGIKDISKDFSDMQKNFAVVTDRVETLWKDRFAPAESPRQLNDKGNDILEKSGIKEIIDKKKKELLELARSKNAKNAYDAEIAIEEVVSELPILFPSVVDRLKNGAFRVGTDMGGVLFVGSIYLRNQIFSDLGFSVGDLDKPKKT